MERLLRWKNEGMSIGSINIAGISNIKIYMLLEVHNLDILCIQETWLTSSTVKLDIPGYQVYEERRQAGKRGGIAMLVRKGIKIIRYISNEYAQGICL
jgi:exonuclease III